MQRTVTDRARDRFGAARSDSGYLLASAMVLTAAAWALCHGSH